MHKTFTPVSGGLIALPEIPGVSIKGYFGRTGSLFSRWLALLILTLGFTGHSQAATITVCSDGCDYSTIQAAITAASSGDVINVQAGTYTGDISVSKSLTLNGPNAGVSGYDQNRVTEAQLLNGRLTVSGTNTIVIDGFHLYNTNNTSIDMILVNSTTTTVTIKNNRFERAGTVGGVIARGIATAIGITTPVVIENNFFTGDPSGGLFGGHLTLNNGIFSNGGSNVMIRANKFDQVRTALNVDNMSAGVTITENIFEENGTALSFGGTTATSGSYTVSGNSFKVFGTIANLSNVTTSFRMNLTGNTFDGKASADLSLAEALNIERTLFHRGRSSRNGAVTFVPNTQFVVVQNPSIQNAITYSEAGGIVQVEAGTFTENVNINKSLDIRGANYGLACGSRGPETVIAPATGLPVNVTADGVTLNGFEITAPSYQYAILCGNRSNLNIAYNHIHDINSSASPALTVTHAIQYTVANAPAATSNVNILNNCISNVGSSALTGNSASAIGFLQSTTTGTLSNLTIAGNTISNVTVSNAAWPTGKIAYGIQLNAGGGTGYLTTTGKIVNALIQNNEIDGLSGHIATGIGLEGNTENASVTGNLVTNLAGTKSGIRSAGGVDVNGLKFENNRFASTVTVTNNSFAAETYSSNNTAGLGYAVANYVPVSNGGTASISCNWLGSSVLSEIVDNDDLTGKILNKDNCTTNFIPFLVSGTDAGASVGFQASSGSCIGGQTVFVKDANTLEVKSGHTTIQAGVNAAAAGDIVEVSAGSYTENVSISKSISLLGPNAGVSGYNAARVAEAQILNGKITISGTNTVVVDGMQIYTTTNSPVDLILINSTTSTVTVKNNRIERFGTTAGVIARGLVTALGITTPVVIEDNFFTGDPTGGLFSGHTTLNNGIFSNGGSNILIKGNKFDQVRTAVNIDNMSAGVTITENIFENNGSALAFGGTTPTAGANTVSGNSFKVFGTIANLSNVTTTFRLDLTGNTFDGKATGGLSLAESFNIERTLFHRGRSSRNGAVTFVPNTQFVVVQNPSIQNAVTYSETGGIVRVEAGTYTEDLLISKPLSLLGANANITYGDAARGAESKIQPLTSGQAPVRLSGAGISDGVTINGFEITGELSNNGIYCGDNGAADLDIKFNYIHSIGINRGSGNVYAINYRVNDPSTSNVNISDNYITNVLNTTAAALGNSGAIWVGQSTANGVVSNLTVERNTISNIFSGGATRGATGIAIEAAWGAGTGGVNSPVIRNNSIANINGGIAYGIQMNGKTPGLAIVENNSMTDIVGLPANPQWAIGVNVPSSNTGNVRINNNSFGNLTTAVLNGTANALDASCNWWGTDAADEILNKISGDVTVMPFLNDGTDNNVVVGFQPTPGSCIGVFPVLVKDGTTLAMKSGHTTIQAGVNAAAAGDIVEVFAGSYTENVSISKSISLLGPNAGVSGYNAARVAEAQILNGKITISGTNTVVVDGMQIYTTTNSPVDLILINSTTSTVTIKNNRIERFGTTANVIARGLVTAIGITTPVVIEDNFFTGDPTGGLFSGHTTLNNGIFSNGGSNILIKGNKFDQVRTAVNIDNMSAGVTITENIFENNGSALAFGGTTPTAGANTVSGNSFKVFGTIANLSNVTTTFRLDLTGNTFDGKATGDLNLEESFNIERTLFHRGRSSRNGAVTFVPNTQFVVVQNPSISNAITYSEAGGIVQVEAGTFTENVTISKSIDLRGANYGVDPNTGTRSTETILSGTFSLQGNAISVDGFEVTGAGAAFAAGGAGPWSNVSLTNNRMIGNTGQQTVAYGFGTGTVTTSIGATNWTVSNNRIEDIQATDATALALFNITGLDVSNNTILHTNDSFNGRRGLNIDGCQNVVIANNNVDMGLLSPLSDNSDGAFTKARYPLQLSASATGRAVSNITVSNNTMGGAYDGIITLGNGTYNGITITGNEISNNVIGIRFQAGTNVPTGSQSNISILNNSINTSNRPIYLQNGTASSGTADAYNNVTISNNSLLRSTVGAVLEVQDGSILTGGPITATCNWFGSASDVASKVVGEAVFTPYLVSGTDSDALATGFQPQDGSCLGGLTVLVKDSATLEIKSGHTTIQAGVNAAASGDIVEVSAGSYTENVSISKSISLVGPNAGIAGHDSTRVAEAQILNGRITISGTNTVVVDGLQIYTTTNSPVDLILINSTTSTVTVKNNRIERFGTTANVIARGLVTALGITTPVVIENNFFTGDPSGGLFSGHTTLNNGIFSNGGSNILIKGNKFDQVRTAVNIDNMSAGVTITQNIFENNGTALAFGGTTATSGSYSLTGNSFKVFGTIANLSNVTTGFRLRLVSNTFDGKATASLNLEESFNIERTLFHRGRSNRNGMVTFVNNRQFVVVQNPSIQNAINYIDAGGTILVEAGTYTEALTVNKALDIRGANYEVPCGSRTAESVIAPASGLPINVTADAVKINGFEITAPSYQYAILCGNVSFLDILYNNIHDVNSSATPALTVTHAIQYTVGNTPGSKLNVKINDNCISNVGSTALTGHSASAIGILQSTTTGVLNNLDILRNSISNVTVSNAAWPTGKIAYGILLNTGGGSGYLTSTGKISRPVIRNNEISGLSGHIATGIALEGNTENGAITGNLVSNLSGTKSANRAGGGVDVNGLKFENNRFASTVEVVNNSFAAETYSSNGTPGLGYAVANYVPADNGGAVSISCNWLGSDLFSEIVDNATLTGKILNKDNCTTAFIPYLINATDNELETIGFQPVSGSCIGFGLSAVSESADALCSEGSGSITVTISGGLAPYSINWGTDSVSVSDTSYTISDLAAGVYSISVTDSLGSVISLTDTISEPDAIFATAQIESEIYCNGGTAIVGITADGGTAPYQYTFDGITNSTGFFGGIAAGANYAYSVTDANGCPEAAGTLSVTEPSVLEVSSAVVSTVVSCNGGVGEVTITATGGIPPYTYSFNGTSNSTGVFTGVLAGEDQPYSVTDSESCGPVTGSITVEQPTLITSSATVSICENDLPYDVNDTTLASSGVYVFTLQASNGCDSIYTLNFTVLSNTASTTNLTICESAYPYTWNGETFTEPGTFLVTLTNAAGCDSLATLNLATFPGGPAAPTNPVGDSRCNRGPVSLSATPPVGATIDWFTAASGGSLVGLGSPTLNLPDLVQTTTFYARSRNTTTGCTSGESLAVTASITIVPVPDGVNASRCDEGTLELTAIPNETFTTQIIEWYDQPIGGTLLGTGTSFTTPVISTTTSFYAEAKDEITGCASISRKEVIARVNTSPQTPTSANNFLRCNPGTLTLIATTASSNATIYWYADEVGGTPLRTFSNSFTTPVLNTTTTYYAEAVSFDLSCISARIPVTAEIGITPEAPALEDVSICGPGQVTLSVPAEEGVAFDWYSTLTGGTALATGTNTFVTPELAANTRYFVAARNEANGCTSTRTGVWARINPLPVVLSPQPATICGSGSGILRASAGLGATIDWFADEACTELLLDGGTLRLVALTTPVLSTTTTFYARARNLSTGCVSQPEAVVATVAERPVIVESTPAERCGPGSVTLSASASDNTTITWHGTAVVSTILATGNVFVTPSLTASRAYFAQARDTISGCTTESRTSVAVTILPIPAAPVAAGTPSTCAAETITLSASVPSGHQISWFTAASGGTLVAENTNSIVVSTSGQLTYFAESRSENTGCVSARTAVSFSPSAAIAAPLGTDGAICNSGRVPLSAAAPTGSVVRWYSTPVGGSILFTGDNYLTPILTATTDYYAESFNTSTGCVSAVRTPVAAVVNPNPNAPATTDVAICGPGEAQLNAPIIEGITYDWYSVLSGGTALATGTSSFTTPVLTATTRFFVAARNETTGCVSSRASILATANPLPAVLSTAPATTCGTGSVSLRATTGTGATVDWFADEACTELVLDGGTLRTVIFSTPIITTTTIFYARARNINTGCVSQPVAVAATVAERPTVLEANSVERCGAGSVTLTAVASNNAIITWHGTATISTILATGNTYITPSLTASRAYFAQARDTITGCISEVRSSVAVTIQPIPAAPVSAGTPSTCAAETVTLSATVPTGHQISWYTAASGGTLVAENTNAIVVSTSGQLTYFAESKSENTGCISARTAISFSPSAAVAAPQGTDGVICNSGRVSISATAPSGAVVRWYSAAEGGNILLTGNTYLTPIISATTVYYAESFNTTTGCISSRTPVTATVNPNPGTPVTTDVFICGPGIAQLNMPEIEGLTYDWYTVLSGGTALATGTNTYTTPFLTANTRYYVAARDEATGCVSTRTAIWARINPLPVVISTTPGAVCGEGTATLRATTGTGATLDWFADEACTQLLLDGGTLRTVILTTPTITTTTTFYVRARNVNTGCVSQPVAVVATVNPLPSILEVNDGFSCVPSALVLSVEVSANATADWFISSTTSSRLATGTTVYLTPSISTSRTYYAVARDIFTGCVSQRVEVQAIIDPSVCKTADSDIELDLEDEPVSEPTLRMDFDYQLKAYPNPTSGLTQLEWVSKNAEKINIRLYNSLGQVAYEYTDFAGIGFNIYQIDLSSVSQGVYYLSITNGKDVVKTQALIKQ